MISTHRDDHNQGGTFFPDRNLRCVKLSPGSFNVHGVLIAKLPAQLRPVAHRPHDDDSYYAIMAAKEFLPLGYLKRQRLI